MDWTGTKPEPPGTPQNGVVFIIAAMKLLGLGPESRLVGLVLINYALHLSGVYPLYRIAGTLGLRKDVLIAPLLAVYMGAFHVYRLQLLPYNDGLFNALFIWLAWFIVASLRDSSTPTTAPRPRGAREWPPRLAVMLGLSVVLVHFRLNALLLVGAALIAVLAAGRYRHAKWTLVLLVASVLSVLLPYAAADTTHLARNSAVMLDGVLLRLPTGVYDVATIWVPRLLFAETSPRASLLYAPFGLALALALGLGLRRKEAGLLFIALCCATGLLYVSALPFTDHALGNNRYLLYIFPFMYLLVLIPRRIRVVGYLFVAVTVFSSLWTFVDGPKRSPASNFLLYVHTQGVTLPEDRHLLISRWPRLPYVYLRGARTFKGKVTRDRLLSVDSVYLIGDRQFVSDRLSTIDSLVEGSDQTYGRRSLTPDYRDSRGHVLLEIYRIVGDGARR